MAAKLSKVDQQIADALLRQAPGSYASINKMSDNGNKSRSLRSVTLILADGSIVHLNAQAGSFGSTAFQHVPASGEYRQWHSTLNGVLADAGA